MKPKKLFNTTFVIHFQIRELDIVDYIEEDEEMTEFVPWGLDRIDEHDLPLNDFYFAKGKECEMCNVGIEIIKL